MTNDIPVMAIKHQAQTTAPVTSDATLVDDPVALVDDPVALSNGPSTITTVQRKAIVSNVPKMVIKRHR